MSFFDNFLKRGTGTVGGGRRGTNPATSAGVIPPPPAPPPPAGPSLRPHSRPAGPPPAGRPGRRPGNVPLYIVRSPFSEKVMPVLLSTAFLRDDYLWPGIQNNSCSLLSDTPERITAQITNMVRIVNKNLKSVWRNVNKSHSVGIPENFTFYSMRSSAASIYLSQEGANIYTLAHLMSRRVEGISTYVASIKSDEELLAERRKLLP